MDWAGDGLGDEHFIARLELLWPLSDQGSSQAGSRWPGK